MDKIITKDKITKALRVLRTAALIIGAATIVWCVASYIDTIKNNMPGMVAEKASWNLLALIWG